MPSFKFKTIAFAILFVVGFAFAIPSLKPTPPPTNQTFEEIHQEVKDFFKSQVGESVKTPIKDTFDWKYNSSLKGVLAYCYLAPNNTFITFNYDLIKETSKGNMDFVYQVILHEYVHCEGRVGHMQMWGHFMNDGGAPWLTSRRS